MAIRILCALMCCALLGGVAKASTITLSGFLDDSGNTALRYYDLTAALFGNDSEIGNNVALYSLSVPVAGNVSFDSEGFTAGGVDPYFTLFQGSGNAATFLESNFAQAFSTGGDFLISLTLSAGDYMLALGAFANLSFAENLGSGTLEDGFSGLGGPGFLGDYGYELIVTLPDSTGPVLPEPSTVLLIGAGLAGLARARTSREGKQLLDKRERGCLGVIRGR